VVNDVAPKDRDIAMVFQSYALYPHMDVAHNMGFALRMQGVSRAARAERVVAQRAHATGRRVLRSPSRRKRRAASRLARGHDERGWREHRDREGGDRRWPQLAVTTVARRARPIVRNGRVSRTGRSGQ
jgi:hypothetical protein